MQIDLRGGEPMQRIKQKASIELTTGASVAEMTRSEWRQKAEIEYDEQLRRDKKAAERSRGKISNLFIWLGLMLLLVIIDVAVYHTLFLDLDLPRSTAIALTMLMALLLQGVPALFAFGLEALTSRWGEYRHSRGAAGLVIVMIFLGVAGTAAGLWIVTVMRLGLYEYGNEFYGQAVNWFALGAPFLTSLFALIVTFIFFPSNNIIDDLVKKATPSEILRIKTELEQKKRDAYVFEHGELEFLRSQRSKAFDKNDAEKTNLTSAKRQAWSACSHSSINGKSMPDSFEDFQTVCDQAINAKTEEMRGRICEAFPNGLDSYHAQITSFLESCIADATRHVNQNHYPDYVGDGISSLTAKDVIDEYNSDKNLEDRKKWNTQESRDNHTKEFTSQFK